MLPTPLNNLNNLNRGLTKQWVWNNRENYHKMGSYLQKISYCIQDLNYELKFLENPSMKDVIYTIVLVDWIREAVEQLPSLITPGLLDAYRYSKAGDIKKARKYCSAIRAFVVAHPLTTSRHSDFGLDGDKICVDIRSEISPIIKMAPQHGEWYQLDFDGLQQRDGYFESDFVMYIYSQSADKMRFFKYVGAWFTDIFRVAELYIESLYDLDRYVGKLKKREHV